ncbi:MAG: MupA/Atu3671 family FMN-dependent luciferase-like monooxygenase, partial [Cognatishimia sp.]|uniref:MupA/Atu3671 family FMN-dependent luciferase-like monooxygenase n=1 Tax=Cognatishimia sp. TaxID=2211648 RepID=UPI0040595EEA
GVDRGDILVQKSFDIDAEDTAFSLNTKAFEAAMACFPELIKSLEAGAKPRRAQDFTSRRYFAGHARPDAMGRIDFDKPAVDVARLVQGLDHGGYWNPLTTAKISVAGEILIAGSAVIANGHGRPGEVLASEPGAFTVACATGAVELRGLSDLAGRPAANAIAVGSILSAAKSPERLNKAMAIVAPQEASWRTTLRSYSPQRLPFIKPAEGPADWATLKLDLKGAAAHQISVLQLFAKMSGAEVGSSIAFAHEEMTRAAGYLANWVPLACEDMPTGRVADLNTGNEDLLQATIARDCFPLDLLARAPELTALELPDLALVHDPDMGPLEAVAINLLGSEQGVRMRYDQNRVDDSFAELLAARLNWISAQIVDADQPVSELDLLPAQEKEMLLKTRVETVVDVDLDQTIHALIAEQSAKTPDATALVFEHDNLSYAELEKRSNQIAQVLRASGMKARDVVGVHCRRGHDLVVACLGILKAGGTYLPLDPAFPADRIAIYVEDSHAGFILSQSAISAELPKSAAQVIEIDADPRLAEAPTDPVQSVVAGADLAYLIFTSGSTGRPKGVMVEHRNVVNFFTGMDAQIDHDTPGTWLAVTSLSFDISVLELFYTLSRGFKVVIAGDEGAAQISDGPIASLSGGMDFSLFYWGNDDGHGRGKYQLLLEGAKFADQNGFCAVWTPERHFHAFGGPYPNPSVTGAAVAAVTENIGVRAGSCVAPLHHTARIAEEWAVIDNLTNGRAGLAIASGWQPDDFVLRPENTPPANKPAMFEQMQELRKLWRGEEVSFLRKDGELHPVLTQPRPVSKDIDLWVTTAGNPETWREAGRNGCHVLTHLLGQSVDEVAAKIKIYHEALRDAGFDPADFKVTLMLHSFVAEDRETAREIAREPMKDYLRSAAGLIKQYAWAFPAFKRPEGASNAFELDLGSLTEEELDGILDFAFQRYFEDSGLFGTVEDCLERVAQVKAIGVTEIACLIDYGIESDVVLQGLRPLARVVAASSGVETVAQNDVSIAGQILRHNVTHLQCTPSMARILTMNDEASTALGEVSHLMIGGEALPGQLVRELTALTDARITNMYGPTETTIWSSTAEATSVEGTMGIGAPIANTQLYALDEDMSPVALGGVGELYIGGAGVTRGYWERPELTEERFVADPFAGQGRMYRTGDLVRPTLEGGFDFIGRADHQVKIRGHRIELGEIESRLEALADVTQAVVLAREDNPGDVRLVAYMRGSVDEAEARTHLSEEVPDYMVPSHFVTLDAFPLTPNKKVDRKALPKPEKRVAIVAKPKETVVEAIKSNVQTEAPSEVAIGDVVSEISAVWSRILGIETITSNDNFFDLGGHSLLAVQCHRELRDA